LEVDGASRDLSSAVTCSRTSPELVKGTLRYVLKYRASALVKIIRTTIEPAAGSFYTFCTVGPARDLDVWCTTDRARKFLMEVFSSNEALLTNLVESPTTLQFKLPGWLNPNEGFIVVPLVPPAANAAPVGLEEKDGLTTA